MVEEEAAQAPCAVVGVEARGDDEAEAAVRSQEGMGLLQEGLVEVDVRRPLVAEGVGRVGESPALPAGVPPAGMIEVVVPAAGDGEAVSARLVFVRIAEGACGITHEVRLGAEVGVVVKPGPLDSGIDEIAGLMAEGLLLAVGAVEGIDVGEELLGVGLGDVPGGIPEDGIEARARGTEDVGEFELPVEEALGRGDPVGDGAGLRRRGMEGRRERRLL